MKPCVMHIILGVNHLGVFIMSIVYIYDVQYICRLLPEGGFILNAYTPISFN